MKETLEPLKVFVINQTCEIYNSDAVVASSLLSLKLVTYYGYGGNTEVVTFPESDLEKFTRY